VPPDAPPPTRTDRPDTAAKAAARRAALANELTIAGRHLGKASAMLNQALADHVGLHPTEWECVGLLMDAGPTPLTAGRIAELTGLTTGAVTGVIDRLERKGWVRRERDPSDRRRVIVHVVPEALAAVGGALGGMLEDMRALEEHYSEDELAAMVDLLGRATEVLRFHARKLRTGDEP
jgi:DNA-binding MarR family transcriptional regulator